MVKTLIKTEIENGFVEEKISGGWTYNIVVGKTLKQQISESISIRLFKKWNGLTDIEELNMEFREWNEKVYEMLGEYEDEIVDIQKKREENE